MHIAGLHDPAHNLAIVQLGKGCPLFLDNVGLQHCLMVMAVLPSAIGGCFHPYVCAAVGRHEPVAYFAIVHPVMTSRNPVFPSQVSGNVFHACLPVSCGRGLTYQLVTAGCRDGGSVSLWSLSLPDTTAIPSTARNPAPPPRPSGFEELGQHRHYRLRRR